MAGLEALREANSAVTKPVKFVYLSGHGISQDFTVKPFLLRQYRIMRVSQTYLPTLLQTRPGRGSTY